MIIFSSLAGLILLVCILCTYQGLINLLQKQLLGLEYHQKTATLYNVVNKFQSQPSSISKENVGNLQTQLISG